MLGVQGGEGGPGAAGRVRDVGGGLAAGVEVGVEIVGEQGGVGAARQQVLVNLEVAMRRGNEGGRRTQEMKKRKNNKGKQNGRPHPS